MDEESIPVDNVRTDRILTAYLHNGASIMVQGNSISIDILKERLLEDRMVKGMAIYTAPPDPKDRVKLKQWNYTQLTEIRNTRR